MVVEVQAQCVLSEASVEIE